MDQKFLDEVTKVLSEYALKKFPIKALEVKGPIREGQSYRWKIISTRFKDVTVLIKTQHSLFSRGSVVIEVYGVSEKRKLNPTVQDLKDFLENAQLLPLT